MPNYLHFIYIGHNSKFDKVPGGYEEVPNYLYNIVRGPSKIIDHLYSAYARRKSDINPDNIIFRFWVINLASDWQEKIRTKILDQADYRIKNGYHNFDQAINRLINSITLIDDDIQNNLILINDPIIPVNKRNIMKKDMCSLAVLKKYGGYFMDNNIYPIDDYLTPGLNLDWQEADIEFKIPAKTHRMSGAIYEHDLCEKRARVFVLNSAYLVDSGYYEKLGTDDDLANNTDEIPYMDCWMMYAIQDTAIINNIYKKYFDYLKRLKKLLIYINHDSKYRNIRQDLIQHIMDGEMYPLAPEKDDERPKIFYLSGVGSVIMNSIISSMFREVVTYIGYVPQPYFNNPFQSRTLQTMGIKSIDPIDLDNREYFWEWTINNEQNTIIEKGIHKTFGGSWRN